MKRGHQQWHSYDCSKFKSFQKVPKGISFSALLYDPFKVRPLIYSLLDKVRTDMYSNASIIQSYAKD